MEKIRGVSRHLGGRRNHFGWDDVLNVATLGIYDIASNEDEQRRASGTMQLVALAVLPIIFGYEHPTTTAGIISMPKLPNGVQMEPYNFRGRVTVPTSAPAGSIPLFKHAPKEFLIDGELNGVKTTVPTSAAYVWAKMRYAIDFMGADPATVAAKYGVPPLQRMDYGKFDWNAALKSAIVSVGLLVAAIGSGGIALVAGAPAAIKGFKAINAQSVQNTIIASGASTAVQQSAQQQAAYVQQQAAAAANQGALQAGFLSFENPYFIMAAMAVASIILFVLFKPKK